MTNIKAKNYLYKALQPEDHFELGTVFRIAGHDYSGQPIIGRTYAKMSPEYWVRTISDNGHVYAQQVPFDAVVRAIGEERYVTSMSHKWQPLHRRGHSDLDLYEDEGNGKDREDDPEETAEVEEDPDDSPLAEADNY